MALAREPVKETVVSIFASQTQSDPIPIPFDPPHTVTVRRLAGHEIEKAEEAHRDSIATGSARSWAVTFRRMLEKGATDAEVMKAVASPLTGYDRYSLVRAGLVAWTYPQSVKPVKAKAAVPAKGATPASPAVEAYDAIDDLDDEAVDFIATEVLRLTKPALFLTAEEDVETAQKELHAVASVA